MFFYFGCSVCVQTPGLRSNEDNESSVLLSGLIDKKQGIMQLKKHSTLTLMMCISCIEGERSSQCGESGSGRSPATRSSVHLEGRAYRALRPGHGHHYDSHREYLQLDGRRRWVQKRVLLGAEKLRNCASTSSHCGSFFNVANAIKYRKRLKYVEINELVFVIK